MSTSRQELVEARHQCTFSKNKRIMPVAIGKQSPSTGAREPARGAKWLQEECPGLEPWVLVSARCASMFCLVMSGITPVNLTPWTDFPPWQADA